VACNHELDQNQSDEKLRQSELMFRTLFKAVTEGVALIDTSGYVIRANIAEAQMSGLDSAAQRTGQHFRCPTCKYFKMDGTPLALEEMATYLAMKDKCPSNNSEVKIVRADNSEVWCNIRAVPIVNGLDQITGAVQTLMNVTEQKMLREEREKYLVNATRAQEEERKRLSRELHDGAAQSLSMLILELDNICRKEKEIRQDTLIKLGKLRGTAINILNEIRRYSHELRPSILDNLGLAAAIESLVDDFRSETRIRIKLNIQGNIIRMADEVELALFRIIQEALTNIRKHSEATVSRVNLRFTPQIIKLSISDNGKGFNVNKSQDLVTAGHLGLVGMKERASLIKGNLRIKSETGRGTTVSVEVRLVD
jgi:two-component system, NarL family, sensor histidine kinase DegS